MADDPGALFHLSQEQAQTAKLMIAGGFGALVYSHLRHPGTVLRAAGALLTGIGIATLFTGPAMALVPAWLAFGPVQVAAVLGLAGNALAAGTLRAIERFDFSSFISKKGA